MLPAFNCKRFICLGVNILNTFPWIDLYVALDANLE